MLRSVLISVVVLAIGGPVARGQFIEQLYAPSMPDANVSGATSVYKDIPGTEKTITVPAGTAVITWVFNLSSVDASWVRIRPVIGTNFPAEGLRQNVTATLVGTWTTNVEDGQITVKLQATSESDTFNTSSDLGVTWTLSVVEPPPVPAISGTGMGIMLLFIVAVGGFVFKRVKLAT